MSNLAAAILAAAPFCTHRVPFAPILVATIFVVTLHATRAVLVRHTAASGPSYLRPSWNCHPDTVIDTLASLKWVIANGAVRLGLNLLANLSENHPIRPAPSQPLGKGVEIVLEVSDVEEMYKHVIAQDWPRARGLMRRPWGLTDFRLSDPDGYYLRVTSRPRVS